MKKFIVQPEQIEYFKKDKKLYAFMTSIPIIEREVKENLFEALLDSLLSQQISNKSFLTIKNRLREKCSLIPEKLYELDDEIYKQCGISYKKTLWIKNLCHKILTQQLDLEKLRTLDDEEVIEILTKLEGVGRWTAEMFCIFALERMDILSYGDYGVRKGIMLLYHHKTLDKERFERYRKRYSPYGTIAAFYLWHIANNNLKL